MNSPLALIVIVLAASVLSVGICRRLGLPSLLGYLVVGMLLGSLAPQLVANKGHSIAVALKLGHQHHAKTGHGH